MEKINQHSRKCYWMLFGLFWAMSPFVRSQNYVPNPSFETFAGCPPSGIGSLSNWFLPPSHTGSPDYHHLCGNTTFGAPLNVFGNQNPRTGSAYIGFVTHFGGNGVFREYLEVLLTAPLTAGISYTATGYLSLSDGSGWATNGFGFYFSNAIASGSGGQGPLPFIPQVSNPVGNYINSWVNWMPVTGTFVATAGLQYMTIGNFRTDAATGVQVMASGWAWNYTYGDDFSVTPTVILTAEIGDFSGEFAQDAAVLHWDTRSEQGAQSFEVERSIGDLLHFERIGTLPAKGSPTAQTDYEWIDPGFAKTQLNYYRLKEVDQNGGGGYSRTIELHTDDLLNEVDLVAYPNPAPAGGTMNLKITSTMEQQMHLDMIDLQGRTVQQADLDLQVGDNLKQVPLADVASGLYHLRLTGAGIQAVQKVMVRASE